MDPYKNRWCKGWKRDGKNYVSNVKGTLDIHVLNITYSLIDIILSMSPSSVMLTINLSKNKCLVLLHLTYMPGSYTFNLPATIDHDVFSMHHGHYTASVYCFEKKKYCNDNKITVCDINYAWGSSTTYIMIYKLLVEWVYNQNTEGGKHFLPWCRYISSISLNTGRGIGTETC